MWAWTLFLLLFLSGCSFFKSDDVIVRVGDISFTEKYFADRLVEKLKNVDGLHIKNRDLIAQFSNQLEKELIEEGFFFLWAKNKNLKISSSELAAYIGTRGTTATGAPTDFIFEVAPAQNLLKNHLRLQIIKNHLLSSFEQNIPITEDELLAEFKMQSPLMSPAMVRAKQILLTKEDDARSVLQKILAGASFEEMAKKFSLSSEGALGGDVGWLEAGSSAQAKWLCQQPVGLITKPVSGPGGFYIYKITESKKSTVQSFADVKEKLRKSLLEKKRNSAYLHWYEEQVKTTPVFSNEKLISTITSHYQETL